MNKIIVLLLLCGLSAGVFAKDFAEYKQERLIARILNQQVKQHISLKNSVSAILTRFPEQVELVLDVALEKYPHKYKDIMLGAMSAEPVLACEVIEIVLKANVADSSDIIAIAVEAEPAYAQEIVNAAVLNDPTDVENIVRVAIQTEPVVSQAVISNTMSSFPEKLIDILTGAIKALPEQVAHFVVNAIDMFPQSSKEVVTQAVTNSEAKHDQLIVDSAVKAGFDHKSAISAAIAGGAKAKNLAIVSQN